MALYLYTNEDVEASLAHGLVLCTREQVEDYLSHHGVPGQKRGIRLYQHKDGSLTPLGRIHYGVGNGRDKAGEKAEKYQKKSDEASLKIAKLKVKSDRATLKSKARPDDESRAEKANRLSAKLAKETLKADKINYKLEKYSQKSKERTEVLEADKKAREEAANKPSTPSENRIKNRYELADKVFGSIMNKVNKNVEQKELTEDTKKQLDKLIESAKGKKEYSDSELHDMAGEEFTGDKAHDDKLQNIPTEAIKKRIQDTIDWFDNKQYETQEERVAELKYLTNDKEFDKMHPLAKKNFGDDLLAYVYGKSEEILSRMNKEKLNFKSYHDMVESDYEAYNELQNWLTDKVYEKSGSWNADDYKRGSNAEKVRNSESFRKLRDDIDKRWDELSEKTGYSSNHDFKKFHEAMKNDSVWQALDKAYQREESNLLGAMLKDLGFRDTPENRYMLMQFAFID